MRLNPKNIWLSWLVWLIVVNVQGQDIPQDLTEENSILAKSNVTIRNVVVIGIRNTKEKIVLREIPVKKGREYPMSYILRSIQDARENLMNTTLFVDATVDFTRWYNDSLDIVVDVKERWYWFPFPIFKPVDRNWNVWINQYNVSLERVNYGLKLLGNNVTGRNDKLNLYIVQGYTKQLALTYQNPYVGNSLKHGISFDIAASRTREINYNTFKNQQVFYSNPDAYARSKFVLGLGYSYKKASVARHFVRLSYNAETIIDTIAKLNPDYFGAGRTRVTYPELTYRYQYFKVNYIPYPLRGLKWDFNFVKRGVSGPVSMTLFNIKGGKYWPMPGKFYYALNGDFTVKFPFNQPFYNQGMMGYGENYLRGLEYYVIDGVASGLIKNTLRKEIFDLKWKTGFKSRTYATIPFKIFLKTYGDMGYCYNPNNYTVNRLNNRFLYSGGFGLDILTIYDVVFRLEYSFNQFHEKALFIHMNEF